MVSLWKIFWIFAKIGAFTIGGGIPMIAAIKSELIERGTTSSLKRLITVQEASTEKIQFIEKR